MGEEYCRAGQATDDTMAHAHSMLGTYDYKHTLRICNKKGKVIPIQARCGPEGG